jgi:2-octaprenyl-6-methoxyphenol hydroxylase
MRQGRRLMAVRKTDVAVVGAGPSGLAATCLVAEAGLAVTLVTGPVTGHVAAQDDPRTIALMQPSIRLLAHLGVWPGELMAHSAPLWRLKLVDDSASLISGLVVGPVVFDAREIGSEPFGWNIPIGTLTAALDRQARKLGATVLAEEVVGLRTSAAAALLRTATGAALSAQVVLGADGRSSLIRAAARIAAVEWSYDQVALASSFAHSAPHRDTSVEYHKSAGPLTTVPMPGGRSSLVWLEHPDRAHRLAGISDEDFATILQAEIHGDLGVVSGIGRRKAFAMQGLTAVTFARHRVMLLGEAAHVLPPIGAQGLNLSFRDAATAAELITNAAKFGDDLGSSDLLERYDRMRRRDVMPRQGVVDAVNRSLLSGSFLPHGGRVAGLMLAAAIGPLRRRIMHQGLGPAELPRVMRG